MGKRKRRKPNSARRKARRHGPAPASVAPEQPSIALTNESEVREDEAEPTSSSPTDSVPSTPIEPSSTASAPADVTTPVMPMVGIPASMRVAFIAAIGAAVVSTAAAVYVIVRPPTVIGPSVSTSLAAATPTPPPTPLEPEPDAAEPDPNPSGEPAAAMPSIGWPDLSVEGLPPIDAAPEAMGQSIGSPRDGALLHGSQMPSSRDYLIRNQDTAWATDNTIEHLETAIASVRKRNPQLHRLVIGDISTRRGGPLDGHTSHQAGRDVDIGMFYRGRPDDGPNTFVEATREILDRRATFDLIAALAETRDDPTGVELIVLDYNLQRILRRAAETRGISEDLLEALFQFPHGPNTRHGLIRHKPAHRDHLHVRFRCPTGDAYCRDPLLGFGGMEAPDPAGS